MQLNGSIKLIGETQTFGDKGFIKREMVLITEEDSQYPQPISIEFIQDKCDILDGCLVGQSVEVSINIKGREWVSPQGEVKHFNTINGWRVNVIGAASTQPQPTNETFEPQGGVDSNEANGDGNLPF
ncbi:MAG: DUF3127 domain-containing protein [Flavobacteriaceae bacterium]